MPQIVVQKFEVIIKYGTITKTKWNIQLSMSKNYVFT